MRNKNARRRSKYRKRAIRKTAKVERRTRGDEEVELEKKKKKMKCAINSYANMTARRAVQVTVICTNGMFATIKSAINRAQLS